MAKELNPTFVAIKNLQEALYNARKFVVDAGVYGFGSENNFPTFNEVWEKIFDACDLITTEVSKWTP